MAFSRKSYNRKKRNSKKKAAPPAAPPAAPAAKKKAKAAPPAAKTAPPAAKTAPPASKKAKLAASKKPAAPKKQAASKTKATAPPPVSIFEASENLISDQCQYSISRKKTPDEDDKKYCELKCDNTDRDLEVIKYKETFQCNLKNTEITLNLNNDVKKLCHYHIKEVLGLKIKKITSIDHIVSEGEVPKRIISYEVVIFNNTLQINDEICGYSTIEGKPDIGNLIPIGNGTNDNVAVNVENIVIATKDLNFGDKLYLQKPTNYKKIEPLKKRLAISGPKGPFTNENTQAPVRVLSP